MFSRLDGQDVSNYPSKGSSKSRAKDVDAPPRSYYSPAPVLLGLVVGTACQLQEAALRPLWVYGALVAFALALVAGLILARGMGWRLHLAAVWLLSTVLGLAAGAGLAGGRAQGFASQALAPALEGQDVQITGRVSGLPQQTPDGVRFRLKVDGATLAGQPVTLPPQIDLAWYAGFGTSPAVPRTPLPMPEPTGSPEDDADRLDAWWQSRRPPAWLRPGERWQMTVRLKAPHGNRNPHGFDYELWLWEQGLQATGSVRTGARDVPPQRLSEATLLSDPGGAIERARQSTRQAIFERVPDRQLAGVVAALVMGDQGAIERADWDIFRATGVAHLMSISGLHITLFAWLAGRLLGSLWRRSARWTPVWCLAVPAHSAGAWGGLLLATAYAVFSGWGVPAQRTVAMLAVAVLLRQTGRQWPWPLVWLLAMAAVVLLDPWALLQAGFWLSFVAVGVLLATDGGAPDRSAALEVRGWRAMLVRAWTAVTSLAREQWVITVALTPLTLLLFNQVSLVGLLANAVAIPWVTLLVTPAALLGVFFGPAWDAAAGLVGALMVLLQFLASWPGGTWSQAAAPLWCALAGLAGGVLLAMRWPWHWRLLGLPLLLPILLWQPPRPAAGTFELLAADVGQGNAVLVRTAGHSLLYDAGPRFSRESDAGHRVLVPLLRALAERLDSVVLSHRDSDHVGGAAAVLAMQPQAQLISSIEEAHALRQQPAERGAPGFVACAAGQRWHWDGVDFEFLHPLAQDYALPARPNARSCVLRISSAATQSRPAAVALLVGDIEQPQERALLDRSGAQLQADFLLMPHHGSKTSSSDAFLDAVQPRLALAQAGYRNRFGHPAPPVLARYEARGVAVYRSDQCGAATWHSDQPGELVCERQRVRRYWQQYGKH